MRAVLLLMSLLPVSAMAAQGCARLKPDATVLLPAAQKTIEAQIAAKPVPSLSSVADIDALLQARAPEVLSGKTGDARRFAWQRFVIGICHAVEDSALAPVEKGHAEDALTVRFYGPPP